jgi:hypothetical protein
MSANTNPTKTFEDRLTEARTAKLAGASDKRLKSDVAINDALKRESVKSLTATLENLYEDLGLDMDRLTNKIKMARRSPYGRISEMITMVASTYAWPIDNLSQAKEIPELQDQMMEILSERGINIDADLLLDIKEAKGFNSFLDQTTFQIVDGIEPEYEELEYYLLTFADAASLPFIDYKMTEASYDRLEAKALDRVRAEQTSAEEALARHQDMNNSGEEA